VRLSQENITLGLKLEETIDLSDETVNKIRKLSVKLKSLKQQRASWNKEAKQWAEKRDKIHKQIKDLRLEAVNTRERRDVINAKVGELKTQRDEAREFAKKMVEESKQLKEKLRFLNAQKPKRTADALRREKEKIEWKIQTTSLTLQEERPFVERANRLQIQLNIYQQINDIKEKITKLQSKIKAANEKARCFHAQLSELAQQSQELHSKMIELLKKTKTLQAEADQYHQIFIQNKQKSQKIHKEYVKIEKQIKALKKELAEKEEKEKMLQQEAARKKLKARALKKLKQGEKLTLEEFKLLGEEET